MMKVDKFLDTLRKTAAANTLYVMGGFGAPAGYGNNRTRYKNNNSYNKQPERQKMIDAAADDCFFFDCCGLIKGVCWDFTLDPNRIYGGADYTSNGVPDWDAKQLMFNGCHNPSTDFSTIKPGHMLWMDGHCGVYLGDGLAVESTPSWANGVQITAVSNIGYKIGYKYRKWTYHGALKYIDYSSQPDPSNYKPGNIYTVSCTGPLRIRTGASTSTDIVDNLYRGDKVLCEDVMKDKDGNTWLKITGYTCAKYGEEVYIK